jgi:hypothetical protein
MYLCTHHNKAYIFASEARKWDNRRNYLLWLPTMLVDNAIVAVSLINN